MALPFKVKINETLSELEKCLSKSITAKEKERIQMIYWLKTNLVSTRREQALLLSRYESTITRWLTNSWIGELQKLLKLKNAPGKASKILGEVLTGLQEKLSEPVELKSLG